MNPTALRTPVVAGFSHADMAGRWCELAGSAEVSLTTLAALLGPNGPTVDDLFDVLCESPWNTPIAAERVAVAQLRSHARIILEQVEAPVETRSSTSGAAQRRSRSTRSFRAE